MARATTAHAFGSASEFRGYPTVFALAIKEENASDHADQEKERLRLQGSVARRRLRLHGCTTWPEGARARAHQARPHRRGKEKGRSDIRRRCAGGGNLQLTPHFQRPQSSPSGARMHWATIFASIALDALGLVVGLRPAAHDPRVFPALVHTPLVLAARITRDNPCRGLRLRLGERHGRCEHGQPRTRGRLRDVSCKIPWRSYRKRLQPAPVVPAPMAVPATATEQKNEKNNDQDRFH